MNWLLRKAEKGFGIDLFLKDEKKEIHLSQSFAMKHVEKFTKLTPRHFSWNHPTGACLTCGKSEVLSFRDDLVFLIRSDYRKRCSKALESS